MAEHLNGKHGGLRIHWNDESAVKNHTFSKVDLGRKRRCRNYSSAQAYAAFRVDLQDSSYWSREL
jgi:hypothetical protein